MTASKISGEEAAAKVLRHRQAYAKIRRRWIKGERSSDLFAQVQEISRNLGAVLANLDCPPRAIWSTLLVRCKSLEDDLVAFRLSQGGRPRPKRRSNEVRLTPKSTTKRDGGRSAKSAGV